MLAIKAMMNFGSPVAKNVSYAARRNMFCSRGQIMQYPKVTIGKKKNRKIVKVKDI